MEPQMPRKSPVQTEVTEPTVETAAEQPAPVQSEPETYPEPVRVTHVAETIPLAAVQDVANAEELAKLPEAPAVTLPDEPKHEPPQHNALVHPAVALQEAAAPVTREAFIEALRQHQNKPVPVYTPPPPSARQISQREAEMNAGRERVAKAQAAEAARPRPKPVVDHNNPPKPTPVYRPGDGAGSRDRSPARLKSG